jgi:hypothetical protein
VSYIAFDRIPYPALIAGDTMRDSLGRPRRFARSRSTPAGRVIDRGRLHLLTLDTGVIDADGFLRATPDAMAPCAWWRPSTDSRPRPHGARDAPARLGVRVQRHRARSLYVRDPDVAATNIAESGAARLAREPGHRRRRPERRRLAGALDGSSTAPIRSA